MGKGYFASNLLRIRSQNKATGKVILSNCTVWLKINFKSCRYYRVSGPLDSRCCWIRDIHFLWKSKNVLAKDHRDKTHFVNLVIC